MSSATEAEYGALFRNSKAAEPLRVSLEEMGHVQPPTTIVKDNATAKGIENQQLKQKHSKEMDMRFHWVQDRVTQKHYDIEWESGSVNKAGYFTKHTEHTCYNILMPLTS